MRLSNQRVQLDLLQRLGVSKENVRQLRDLLPSQDDQLSADISHEASFSGIERAAAALSSRFEREGSRVDLPLDAIRAILAPPSGDVLRVGRVEDYPVPTLRSGEARSHAASLDATVGMADLRKCDEAVKGFLGKAHPELAAKLEAGTATVGELGQALCGDEAMKKLGAKQELALAAIGAKGGLAHEARDLELNLDSKFSSLGGTEQVGLYARRSMEWMSVKRDPEAGKFTVHGFEKDAIVVTAPKGAQVLFVDGGGDQRGVRIQPKKIEIDGETHLGVAIDRSMARGRSGGQGHDPAFAVKVIDADGKVLFNQGVKFDFPEKLRSQRIFSGQIGTHASPDETLTELWDQQVPDRSNPVPVGQRPRFELEGGSGDRLRIRRDGQTFDLDTLHQFLEPPKGITARYKAKQGVVELNYRNTSEDTLDRSDYNRTASGKLRLGTRGVSFDRSLHATRQARWGSRGIEVFEEGMRQRLAMFDPLDPQAALQPRKP